MLDENTFSDESEYLKFSGYSDPYDPESLQRTTKLRKYQNKYFHQE